MKTWIVKFENGCELRVGSKYSYGAIDNVVKLLDIPPPYRILASGPNIELNGVKFTLTESVPFLPLEGKWPNLLSVSKEIGLDEGARKFLEGHNPGMLNRLDQAIFDIDGTDCHRKVIDKIRPITG